MTDDAVSVVLVGTQGPQGPTGATGPQGPAGLTAASRGGVAILMGDSLMGNGYGINATGNNIYFHQRGAFNWFQAMAGWPYAHVIQYYGNTISAATNTPPAGHNVGIGSTYTRQMLARFRRDVLSKNPSLVVLGGGTNDVTEGRTANEIARNKHMMAKLAVDQGASVWIETIPPRHNSDGKQFTAPQRAVATEVNRRTRDFAARTPGVILIDLDLIVADVNGDLQLTLSDDGLHWNSRGGETVARLGYLPAWKASATYDKLRRDIPEAYNVTTAPYGNLLSNADFATGTGGTAGTGVTGSVPSGFQVTRSGTLTVAASVVSRTNFNGDTVNAVRLAITSPGGGADNGNVQFLTSPSTLTSGVSAFTWYRAEAEVVIPAGTLGVLRSVYLEQQDTTGTATSQRMFSTRYSYENDSVNVGTVVKDLLPNGDLRLILRTPDLFTDGTSGIIWRVRVEVDETVAGTRTVDIMEPVLHPLPFAASLDITTNYRPIYRVTLHAAANAGVTTTNAALAGTAMGGTWRHVTEADLSACTQARILLYVSTIGATGAKAILRYATPYSQTVTDYADIGVTEVSVPIDTTGFKDSGWIDLRSAALRDVFLAMIVTGDGVADPIFDSCHVEFR